MKTLVLGDIHGRNCWIDIIKKENPDKVIFLGDYVTSRDRIKEDKQIENLQNILDYKETNPNKVILLRGNHDMEGIKYYWAQCWPGFQSDWLKENAERFLADTQWIYIEGDMIFSHAGITQTWFNNIKEKTGISRIEEINNLPPSELFGFTPNNIQDMYGYSETQPCTWVRPTTLLEDGLKDKIFFVGHTRFPKIIDYQFNTERVCDVYCCDTLPFAYITIVDDEIIYNEFEKLLTTEINKLINL